MIDFEPTAPLSVEAMRRRIRQLGDAMRVLDDARQHEMARELERERDRLRLALAEARAAEAPPGEPATGGPR